MLERQKDICLFIEIANPTGAACDHMIMGSVNNMVLDCELDV